jgi:hypothetical protein
MGASLLSQLAFAHAGAGRASSARTPSGRCDIVTAMRFASVDAGVRRSKKSAVPSMERKIAEKSQRILGPSVAASVVSGTTVLSLP